MSGISGALLGAKGFTPLSVAASNVSRTRSGSGAEGLVTSVALPNTTVTGGVPPYTYLWVRQSGDVPEISSDTAQNPTWSETVPAFEPSFSVQRVTVTDAMSATAFTDIEVTLTWVQI